MQSRLKILKENATYKTTYFQNWEKRRHATQDKDILGVELALIEYLNPENKCVFSLRFTYGEVDLNFKIESFKRYQHDSLLEKLRAADTAIDIEQSIPSDLPDDKKNKNLGLLSVKDDPKLLRWGSYYRSHISKETPEDDLSDVGIEHTLSSNEIKKLSDSVNIFAQFAAFSKEMINDILFEINAAIKNQKNHIDNLTNRLCDGDEETIKEIQNEISSFINKKDELVIKLINSLAIEGKVQEGILWCNIFSEKHTKNTYLLSQKMALELLMRLKDMTDDSAGEKEEIVFPCGANYSDLSYHEASFKYAWNIAKNTADEADISVASRLYEEISGGSVAECGFSISLLSGADVLIQQVRIAKLQSENEKLQFENMKLSAQLKQIKSQQVSVVSSAEVQPVSIAASNFCIFKNQKSSTIPLAIDENTSPSKVGNAHEISWTPT